MRRSILVLICAASVLVAGCESIGPRTVPADRFNYTTALADSWKTQMLLNLVKIRYSDAPVFLDVSQLVSGYSFGGTVAATASLPFDGVHLGTAGLAAGGSYSQTPTISYTPMTG